MPCSCGRALLPGETQCERCRRREYERRRQRARHQYETRICEECGAPYETTKTSNRHTCGAPCAWTAPPGRNAGRKSC